MEDKNVQQKFTKVNKWLILVVATLAMMVDFALLFSLGAVYIDVMETFQADRATAAVVQSLMTGVALGFGVFSGALITTLGLPIVTFIASVLVPFGFISSYFITNIHVLYVTIGIISAIGTSMTHVSSVTVAGRVFKGRHQLMSITILNTAVGFSSLGYPYLLSWLTESFGLSGTFLILGGITLNTFLLCVVCFMNRKSLSDGHAKESQMPAREKDSSDIIKVSRNSTRAKVNSYSITYEKNHKESNDSKSYREEGTRNMSFVDEQSEDSDVKLDNCDSEKQGNVIGNDEHALESSMYENEKALKRQKQQKENIKSDLNREKSDKNIDKEEENMAKRSSNNGNNKGMNQSKSNDQNSQLEPVSESPSSSDSKRLRKIHILFKELMTKPYVCLVLAFAFGNISLNGYLGVKIDIATWKGLNASEGLSSFLAFNCSNIVSRFIPGLLKERKGINSFFYPVFSAVSGFCGQLLIYFSEHISVYMIGVCFCGIAFGGIVSSSINATVRIVRLELVPIAVGFLISVNGVLIVGVGPLFDKALVLMFFCC